MLLERKAAPFLVLIFLLTALTAKAMPCSDGLEEIGESANKGGPQSETSLRKYSEVTTTFNESWGDLVADNPKAEQGVLDFLANTQPDVANLASTNLSLAEKGFSPAEQSIDYLGPSPRGYFGVTQYFKFSKVYVNVETKKVITVSGTFNFVDQSPRLGGERVRNMMLSRPPEISMASQADMKWLEKTVRLRRQNPKESEIGNWPQAETNLFFSQIGMISDLTRHDDVPDIKTSLWHPANFPTDQLRGEGRRPSVGDIPQLERNLNWVFRLYARNKGRTAQSVSSASWGYVMTPSEAGVNKDFRFNRLESNQKSNVRLKLKFLKINENGEYEFLTEDSDRQIVKSSEAMAVLLARGWPKVGQDYTAEAYVDQKNTIKVMKSFNRFFYFVEADRLDPMRFTKRAGYRYRTDGRSH